MHEALPAAISTVPPGAWGVAVSGGADSVALLALVLEHRPDIRPHIIHLDHETRGEESRADAAFVAELARKWGLPLTTATRGQIEPALADPPANRSALFRALRLRLFAQAVQAHALQGVLVAHHADDQAETVLHRLLRGSTEVGVAGMRADSVISRVRIVRPLLPVRRSALRDYLRERGLSWREDSSNASNKYQRNRIRQVLNPALCELLLNVGHAMESYRDWLMEHAPELPKSFAVSALNDMPLPLAEVMARKWLVARGAPAAQIDPASVQRLLEMAADAASAPRQQFPGNLRIRRRAGVVFLER